jgi:glycosyltransferase involved in cell wall biosynthesis
MSRPLRILQVTDFYEPFVGGMEQHVQTLSLLLARHGHEVTVATARLPGTAEDETADGVRVRRIAGWASRALAGRYERSEAPFHPPMPDPGVMRGLAGIIAETRPDIVHAQGWMTYSCLAVGPRRSFRLVVTLHDHGMACPRRTLMRHGHTGCPGPQLGACLRCAPGQYGTVKGAALTVALRASRSLHGRADSWVANSQFVADASRRVLPRGTEISVIPPASQSPPPPGNRPDWLPPDGYLLFVGALGRHKGLNWLLDAYASGGITRPLVVIGTERADTPAAWPAGVTVRTSVAHQQVMEAWRHAGVGVVPSLWPEPFGLVGLEAGALGVPAIAVDAGGVRQWLREGVNGVAVREPASGRSFGDALASLLGDPDTLAALRDGAYRVAREMTLAAHVDRLEPILEEGRHHDAGILA